MTPTQPFVRSNLWNFQEGDPFLTSLRNGVAVMQSRNSNVTDPTSWIYQANMHGTYDQNVQPNWNGCQHASFFFLSWHRMYIYYFERILRAASGNPNFALPYWNYSDVPEQAALPPAYRPATIPGTNDPNPLYVAEPNRAPGINEGSPLPASDVLYTPAFTITNFTNQQGQPAILTFGGGIIPQPDQFSSFTGALENQPHNAVHNDVGGQQGWMSDPNLAAQDPIFWAHHSNIDRLWASWLALGGGRVDPSDNNVWSNQIFNFFDENGQPVTLTGAQIIDTAQQLDYQYDSLSTPPPQPIMAMALPAAQVAVAGASTTGAISLTTAPAQVSVALTSAPPVAAAAAPSPTAHAAAAGKKIVLTLEGIDWDRIPAGNYEVYLNLPDGVTPYHTNDHYVGNLGMFGFGPGGRPEHAHAGHAGHHHGKGNVAFDITNVVAKLYGSGKWDPATAKVTFVPTRLARPVGYAEPSQPAGEQVRIERIKIQPY